MSTKLTDELREAADEAIDRIDGGDECRAYDAWLTNIAALMNKAAERIESTENGEAGERK